MQHLLKRRPVLYILLLGIVALLVAACAAPVAPAPGADGDTEGATDGAMDGEQIVLRVGTGDSGEGLAPHQEIIRRFEEANPDITVQLEPVSGSDYYARLLTQIAAGDAPDIMNIGDDAVPQFVDAEAFLPLDDFIAGEDGLDTSIYLPGLLEPGQWEGQQWFLPKDYSPMAVYYNKAIFDEYGVPYPEAGWTWDDLVDVATQLTVDTDGDGTTDIWGLQLPGPWTTGFEYWVGAAGGSLISEDGESFVGFMDSPETTAAVQLYQDLYHTYKVSPPPADMSAWGGGNSEFNNAQAAMMIFGRWFQGGFLENPNIDLGLVGTPAGAVDANVLFWGGFGIFSGTEHPEAAWRFLKFYAGEEGAEVWLANALPAVTSVAEEAGLSEDPIEGVWLNELERLVPRAYVFTPYWGQAADPALRRVLENVILDPEASAAELTAAAAEEAQSALEEASAE